MSLKLTKNLYLNYGEFKNVENQKKKIEGALSGLRQFLAISESPLKMTKNVFYFTLEFLFVLKVLQFLS